MSTIFGFIVGYLVGARAGADGFERLEQAFREVRESDEFRNLLQLAKSHFQGTVQVVNDRLKDDEPMLANDMERMAAEARARLHAD